MPENRERVIVFDFFGTLFDISTLAEGIYNATGGGEAEEFLNLWRRKQLEYSYLLTVMGRYERFTSVTERALRYTLSAMGYDVSETLIASLMRLWLNAKAYPEVKDTLSSLAGCRLSVLSNGDPEMLETGVSRAGIRGYFDRILSVHSVGVFKPHHDAYSVAEKAYGIEPKEMMFISSNGWDIAGASEFGFTTVWVNRSRLPVETLDQRPSHVIPSLDHLPQLL